MIITPAIKCCQEDAPDKGLDCVEEEGGDAEASATDDDKAASILDKQILAIFGCQSNNMIVVIHFVCQSINHKMIFANMIISHLAGNSHLIFPRIVFKVIRRRMTNQWPYT